MAIQADRYGFRDDLFNTYRLSPPPNLNEGRGMRMEQGGFSAYCITSDQGRAELGIVPVEALGQIQVPVTTDLKEISRVVHTILENKPELQSSLEEVGFNSRVTLYCHLKQIASYIDTHNRRVESNFWVQLVNVILLVLTLGIFSYKDQLLVKELVVSLKDLVSGNENNRGYYGERDLPLHYIVGMEKSDQELYLKTIGHDNSFRLNDKPGYEISASQNSSGGEETTLALLDKLSSLPQDLLAPFTLCDLRDIVDFLSIPPEQVTIHQLDDPRKYALLMTKLSPHVSPQHLEGQVADWNELPFDQLRRMDKEQFVEYVDAFDQYNFPRFVSFFPWSVRKYALENSTTLMGRSYNYRNSSEEDEVDSKEFDERKFCFLIGWPDRPSAKESVAVGSRISELNQEAQAKVPGQWRNLLPLSFFQNLDWATPMSFEEMRSALIGAPEGFFAHIPFEIVKTFLEECSEKGELGSTVQMVRREIEEVNNGVVTKRLIEEPVFVQTGSGFNVLSLITSRIAGTLGIDWFLETPERAHLFEVLVATGKISGDVSRFSSPQLRHILEDDSLFVILQRLFSGVYWNSLSPDEILSLSPRAAEACMAVCSDQKLREIIEHLKGQEGNGVGHPVCRVIPPLRLCDNPLLEDVLPEWIQEQNTVIRSGRVFLQNNQQLDDKALAKKIEARRDSMRNPARDYPLFWLGLRARTHETYLEGISWVKRDFQHLDPSYRQY